MEIDLAALSPNMAYHAMIQTIVPRPIAWVLSDNGDQSFNVAPFSYFTGVCSRPPTLAFSVGYKNDGSPKDTRVNIEARSHFVVHIANSSQAHAVTDTARALPHGASELDHIEHSLTPFGEFSLPRLEGCPVAMACELDCVHEIGEAKQGMIFGRIRSMYLSDDVAQRDERGRIYVDIAAFDPLARLGGEDYARLGTPFTIARPR